jgi:GT2 family glycosyltransferase
MTGRDPRAALARLEIENRAVRQQLDLVLSSKGRRALMMAAHPLWSLRGAAARVLDLKPLAAGRDLWKEFCLHRVSLSSIAALPDANAAAWNRELGISGEVHEGLLCDGTSLFAFRAPVGRGVRLRARCALLPQVWDTNTASVEFRAVVRLASGSEYSALRVLTPSMRWSDRRWRALDVRVPPDSGGDVVVTLETRVVGAPEVRLKPDTTRVPVAWGELVLEWPRSAAERRQLLRGAVRRLREWGLGGTLEYARGRRRGDDQDTAYAQWVNQHTLSKADLEALSGETAALPYRPLLSVITPAHNTPPDVLAACVESVRGQAYTNWQHCIADDGSTAAGTVAGLRQYSDDPRVRLVRIERGHVSVASNAALSVATGEFVAFLDHDDELAPEALAEVVRYLNAHPDADVIYSDEDKLDETGQRCEPYFKPDWSPELFLNYMYTCHLMMVRRSLVEEAGGFRRGFEGAQDYDLLLRLMEKTTRIHHIPRVLYHWRKSPSSTASSGAVKPWALEAGRRALEDYAKRTGLAAEVRPGPHPGMYRVRRSIRNEPLVSIVIPTTGRPHGGRGDLFARCLRSLGKTAWRRLEVIVATDDRELTAGARHALERLPHSIVHSGQATFNFSHKVNEAVRRARGEHVLLFNDDLEVTSSDWLTSLLELSQLSDVGAVGAKLVYPDGRLQHVGMLMGVCGLAAHAFHRFPGSTTGYFGSTGVTRECSAVTAACLMTRKVVFEEVGGFDEELPVDFNDVDFCLRLRAAGYRVLFTPYAELTHHESASFGQRVQSQVEASSMRQRWGAVLERDPYYNPNLSKLFSDYRLQL